MRVVIAAMFLLVVVSVQANQACNVELEGGLRITNAALEFTSGEQTRYKILNDETLVVNNRPLNLDSKQQLLVKQYAASIRTLVPEVHQLTLDGVDLASDAVGLVFQELLEPDNQTARQVHNEFISLRNDIENSFASDKPIHINQKGLQANDFLGMNFEDRINRIVEESGKEIGWSVMKNIGAAVFSDDGKKGNLEVRMNKFGERMEREMKARADKMEQHGGQICSSILILDQKEEALKKSIKEIAEFNFIVLSKIHK